METGSSYGKLWGKTKPLFAYGDASCHSLQIKKGYTCSWHKHKTLANGFHVLSGKLAICVQKNDYQIVDYTMLEAGECTTVKAGEFHRFIALEDTLAVEWYYPDCPENDIERTDCAKRMTVEELKQVMRECS